jgi:phosphatidylglycerol:prolipoprotein diacylglycerol transferase
LRVVIVQFAAAHAFEMHEVFVAQLPRAIAVGFPVYFHLGSWKIHPHLVFEALAYSLAFRFYLYQRRRSGDALDDANRWWVIAAAAVGAVVGSRLLYWFEDPQLTLRNWSNPAFLMGGKTIVGALIGALFSVEGTKKILGIKSRTGDLFAAPLCLGIAIGRLGCFLTGLQDHTAGIATTLPWGTNFGDGVLRHPSQLYESAFALILFVLLLWRVKRPHPAGSIFRLFMVAYFAFRFFGDFLKPDVRVIAGLSTIQCASLLMLLYYGGAIFRDVAGVLKLEGREGTLWMKN